MIENNNLFLNKKLVGIDLYIINPLREVRRQLRSNMTEAERILWSVLKQRKPEGRKFRRQFSIGYYIADFYCHLKKQVLNRMGNTIIYLRVY